MKELPSNKVTETAGRPRFINKKGIDQRVPRKNEAAERGRKTRVGLIKTTIMIVETMVLNPSETVFFDCPA